MAPALQLSPQLPDGPAPLKQWEDWLGTAGVTQAQVFAHPAVTDRCRSEDLGLPALPAHSVSGRSVRVSDGLEWPLRAAAVWQQIRANPIRLTQQNALFKRDLQRLQTDPLLNAPFADHVEGVAEPGVLALEVGLADGLLETTDAGLAGSYSRFGGEVAVNSANAELTNS